jgi:hypothetical protein
MSASTSNVTSSIDHALRNPTHPANHNDQHHHFHYHRHDADPTIRNPQSAIGNRQSAILHPLPPHQNESFYETNPISPTTPEYNPRPSNPLPPNDAPATNARILQIHASQPQPPTTDNGQRTTDTHPLCIPPHPN